MRRAKETRVSLEYLAEKILQIVESKDPHNAFLSEDEIFLLRNYAKDIIELKYAHLARIWKLEHQIISVFSEDKYPVYRQGQPEFELEEIATAEEVNKLVSRIRELEQKL